MREFALRAVAKIIGLAIFLVGLLPAHQSIPLVVAGLVLVASASTSLGRAWARGGTRPDEPGYEQGRLRALAKAHADYLADDRWPDEAQATLERRVEAILRTPTPYRAPPPRGLPPKPVPTTRSYPNHRPPRPG